MLLCFLGEFVLGYSKVALILHDKFKSFFRLQSIVSPNSQVLLHLS